MERTLGGYTVRGRHLALNVKVHRGPTEAELAEVAAELGIEPDDRAPARCGGVLKVWGSDWIEESEAASEGYGAACFAVEYAMERAEELARELFGAGARVYLEGRSAGWLVLEGPGLSPESADEALAIIDDPSAEMSERVDALAFVANLERYRSECAAYVADFPRMVAWEAAANGFLPALEESRKKRARADALDRLERAHAALYLAARGFAASSAEHDSPIGVALREYAAAVEGVEETEGE